MINTTMRSSKCGVQVLQELNIDYKIFDRRDTSKELKQLTLDEYNSSSHKIYVKADDIKKILDSVRFTK